MLKKKLLNALLAMAAAAGLFIGGATNSANSTIALELPEQDFSKLQYSDQTDAFGACGAAYGILAVGDNADLFGQFANGAGMALGMIPVKQVIESMGGYRDKRPSNSPELLAAISTARQAGLVVMESETTTHRTRMMSLLSADRVKFTETVGETIEVCRKNAELQQEYVDLFRDLIANGWINLR